MSAIIEPEEIELEPTTEQVQIPDSLPILPLRDIVIFPYMIVPLFVQRERSIRAVEQALGDNRMIILAAQRDLEKEEPLGSDLYNYGTVASIMRMLKMPDGRIRILVQGLSRARVSHFEDKHPYLIAHIKPLPEPEYDTEDLELEALNRSVRSSLEQAMTLGKNISAEVMAIVANLDDPGRLADVSASNLDLKVSDAQSVLEKLNPAERLRRVNELLQREINVLRVQQDINTQAKGEIDRSQREFFLRQQLKAIQTELGEGNEIAEEIAQYRHKAIEAKMPEEVASEVERQIKKLERMHPDAAEAATLRNYLDVMVALPWAKSSEENLDLKRAQKILDEDHYGLEKVKERIIESLAVRKLKDKVKGPILCLVGPPGVGKTSLGRSIARALNRKFQRLSLGGLHDEAEIRGHRRTYIGAMPGRIVQSIQQAGTNNPLIMLDEIDKVGADFRGDPSSALLEVLDPEQNFSFRDNYLGVPFDLSNVMFMTTANMLDTIHPALRDRMELIRLAGYTEEEKMEIARRHIIPKQMEENGISAKHIAINRTALKGIIQQYTREAGLRQFERDIAAICRKVARKVAEGDTQQVKVTDKNLHDFLGAPKAYPDEVLKKDQVGVATGLAWTPAGGDVLFIEALLTAGKGGLLLTGQLGNVMKESAQAALSWAKSKADEFGITQDKFEKFDIHVHVPEGAIPKDGPSAGVTMTTALVSALSGKPIKRSVAMTGEITLRGNVLPVGGVKEKVLAAKRAHVTTIVLPKQNERDLEEIPKELLKEIDFIFVDSLKQVLKTSLA
ncbi:MAG: endopeptidase La [Acidobacteriota bacterium]